jgi:drug/metabolite transporter (DMT)-like permease
MSAAAPRPENDARGAMLLMLSCVAVWGVNAVAFKAATKPTTGVGFDPFFLTGLRFLIVTPCMAAMVALKQPGDLKLQKGDWLPALLFGFVAIVLGETLQPLSLRFTSVANLTLLSHGTISLFTAFWAAVLFKQRIARSGWLGALIAMIGVGIVAASGRGGGLRFDSQSFVGDGIALFRSVEHSLYLLMLSRWMQKHPVAQVTFYNCAFGALWMLPYVIYKGWDFPWSEVPASVWWAFAWTIVPTTLYGFLAWNWAMSKAGAVAATNVFYFMPLAAAVSAWALLGEPITSGQMVGGVVIVAGVILLRWDAMVQAGILRLPENWREWRERLQQRRR